MKQVLIKLQRIRNMYSLIEDVSQVSNYIRETICEGFASACESKLECSDEILTLRDKIEVNETCHLLLNNFCVPLRY
jgi:hypothetical protein